MKIADILGLRQPEELRPRQRQRILDEPADLELPRLDGDVRVLAKSITGQFLTSCCPTGRLGMPCRFA